MRNIRRAYMLTGLILISLLSGLLTPSLTTPRAIAASNYLHTSGSTIYDSSNQPVGLSGLNWFGFETSNFAPHGLWARSWGSMLDQIKSLGYNVIRLPFSNAMLESNPVPTGIDYTLNPDLANLTALQVMDKIIGGAGQRGLKVILDDHRSTPGGGPESGGLWYTSGYPESSWIADWQMLASRYKGTDTVIGADLRNEPYGGCWGCGDSGTDWRLAAERGGNAILAINSNWLIIVEGVSTYNGQSTWWGGNLMGAKDYPVRLNVAGRLVYSPHEYPASVAWQTWFGDPTYPNNLPAIWDQFWGYLQKGNVAPIMVGEFGSKLQTTSDQQWFQAFTSYIKQNRLNWTFWSLNPDSGDTGGLLADDWTTVKQAKQTALAPLQFAALGSGSGSASTSTPTPTATAGALSILDDFESGNTARWAVFKDGASTINVSIVSPGATGTFGMQVGYSISSSGYGGVQQAFSTPQDWSKYAAFRFSFYGANTGHTFRLEIMDDRAAGSTTDTSERFEYKFVDNFTGWKTFTLLWPQFTRRTDWQPAGAPNNGLTLTQMWGYSFASLSGSGSFAIDDNRLLTSSSLATATPTPTLMPTAIPRPTLTPTLAPTATPTLQSLSLLIDDFESGSASTWNVFRDANSSFNIGVVSPGEAGKYALGVTAAIALNGWGGVMRSYATPEDWTAYNSMDFWMYGGNTGSPMRLEVLDNRAAGSTTDTSERFEFLFTDNWTGWRHFTLPWSSFSRRTDWQPSGAPNDGFGRSEIWGFDFAVISGMGLFQIDEIRLTN